MVSSCTALVGCVSSTTLTWAATLLMVELLCSSKLCRGVHTPLLCSSTCVEVCIRLKICNFFSGYLQPFFCVQELFFLLSGRNCPAFQFALPFRYTCEQTLWIYFWRWTGASRRSPGVVSARPRRLPAGQFFRPFCHFRTRQSLSLHKDFWSDSYDESCPLIILSGFLQLSNCFFGVHCYLRRFNRTNRSYKSSFYSVRQISGAHYVQWRAN